MKKSMVYLRGSVLIALVFLFVVGFVGVFITDDAVAQTRPALVQDVENPAQNPFLASGSGSNQQGITNFFFNLDPPVPVGKRLAIEFVSISCSSSNTDEISRANLWINKKGTGGGYSSYAMPIPLTKQGIDVSSGKTVWVAAQLVRLYSDYIAGANIQMDIHHKNWSEAEGTLSCYARVVGGTVSAP
jgi:hypothetical protein